MLFQVPPHLVFNSDPDEIKQQLTHNIQFTLNAGTLILSNGLIGHW